MNYSINNMKFTNNEFQSHQQQSASTNQYDGISTGN